MQTLHAAVVMLWSLPQPCLAGIQRVVLPTAPFPRIETRQYPLCRPKPTPLR
jgi:hypothetical protein